MFHVFFTYKTGPEPDRKTYAVEYCAMVEYFKAMIGANA